MTRRNKPSAPASPEPVQTVLANGKYTLVYKRAPAYGAPENIEIGDVVSYRDSNHAQVTGEVAKVMPRARKLRIAPRYWKKWEIRKGCFLLFPEVIEAIRPVHRKRKTKVTPEASAPPESGSDSPEADLPPGVGALIPDLTPEVAPPTPDFPAPKTGLRESRGSVPPSEDGSSTIHRRRRWLT